MAIVLSLHCGHDANLSIFKNDQLIGYCNSERLSGVRHQGGLFGDHIYQLILEAGLVLEEIDYIALCSTQGREVLSIDDFPSAVSFVPNGLNLDIDFSYIHRNSMNGLVRNSYVRDTFYREEVEHPHVFQYPQLYSSYKSGGLKILFKNNICEYVAENPAFTRAFPFQTSSLDFTLRNRCQFPILMSIANRVIPGFFISHHLSHAFSAISKHAFESSNPIVVITADGAGAGHEGNLICVAIDSKLYPIATSSFYGGPFYENSANFLNLSPGKFMGLSGHSDPDKTIAKAVYMKYITEEVNLADYLKKLFEVKYGCINACLEKNVRYPNSINALFAATTQYIFQLIWNDFIVSSVKLAERITKSRIRHVCLGGGTALNCPGNAFVAQQNPEIQIFIDPSCNDEGLSIGAGLALINSIESKHLASSPILKSGSSSLPIMFNPYIGQGITAEDQLENVCVQSGFSILPFDLETISWKDIAHKLVEGEIGFIMRGPYEVGPRALGNRSIIALATFVENHERVNKIKDREQWRPLAPAVLDKDFDRYFIGTKNPYMLTTNQVKLPALLPSITHADGSARVQCVYPLHENFFAILNNLSHSRPDAHPVIINTSLNGKNQPMLNDCRLMMELFKHADVDFAVTDNYLITKR